MEFEILITPKQFGGKMTQCAVSLWIVRFEEKVFHTFLCTNICRQKPES